MSTLHKRRQLHWAEYAAEGLGTGLLVLVGLSAVVFNFGAGLPMQHWIPDASLRRLLTGLLFSGTGSLIAISPIGKLSGAHINPSVSLAFWMQGKMHRLDFAGYAIAQCLGAIVGAFLLVRIWGSYAASVNNGMTLPGENYALGMVFLAEVSMTFLLVLLIFLFVSSPRLLQWTPLMNWIVVAVMVWLESPISGTSLNPARSLGPALISGRWTAQWLYAVAPPLGAMLAVVVFRFFERDVLTGKLFHVPHYRSIFKNVKALYRMVGYGSLEMNDKLKKGQQQVMNNIEVIQELYRAFREKDYNALLRISIDDLEWIQNAGFPGGTTRKGAFDVVEGVFKANNTNWEGFAYEIEQFLDAGNSVIAIGQYKGRNRVSGKSMCADAAHIYDLRDGKVCRFRMFADTKMIWDAMA